ncbi:hypothetical protein IB269_20525 [Delftia sp. DLF01]|uniref:hypothetical protein n=1 Tax=Delftia sp. DLF01 TaxID=2769279 RepID=UPI001785AE4E|nr:hypothetical protein [Delftia sp. DLF01]MBD9583778.1 hypothetical protein [Delftia sp. DLF01]
MLQLESILASRLKSLPAFGGWHVSGASESVDRSAVPAAQVRMASATGVAAMRTAAQLQPTWVAALMVPRGAQAAAALGEALGALVEALHNWSPGAVHDRFWTPFQFVSIQEAAFPDPGLVGYEAAFTTTALFDGQP